MDVMEELINLYDELVLKVIAEKIKEEYGENKDYSRREWNSFIYKSLIDIGRKKGYGFSVKESVFDDLKEKKINEDSIHEYLVDFCWWIEGPNMYGLELALELEWNPEKFRTGIDIDIYKLFDIKAPLKIGILGCTRNGDKLLRTEEIKDMKDELILKIKNLKYKLSNEGFLFIFIDNYNAPKMKQKHFGIQSFIITTKNDYHEFEPLDYRNLEKMCKRD